MTYGRVYLACSGLALEGAAVSHLAELVRGDSFAQERRPPHPAFGHLLPKGFSCETRWGTVLVVNSARGGGHG